MNLNKQLNILPPAREQSEIGNTSTMSTKRQEFINELSNNGEYRKIAPLQHIQENQNIEKLNKRIIEENEK